MLIYFLIFCFKLYFFYREKVNSFCVESLNNFFICSPKISKHKVSSNLSNSSATSSEKARKDNDLVKLSSNDEDSITESKLAQEKKREREEGLKIIFTDQSRFLFFIFLPNR